MCTVLLPTGVNPIVLFYVFFVCKCVLYYCHLVSTQLCCSMYCLCVNVYCATATACQPNCVVLCIVCVEMCTVVLPPRVKPIVSFYVLFVCKCVLYYCHRVSTQLSCSMYCLCVNVYCTTANRCQHNCVVL
jgi:hypothetical protein